MIGRMQRGLEGPLQSLTPIMGRSHWGKGPLWGEAALPGEGPLGEGANGQEPLGEGKLEKKRLDSIFFLSELALSAAYSLPTTPPTSEGTDQRQRQGTPHNHPYAASILLGLLLCTCTPHTSLGKVPAQVARKKHKMVFLIISVQMPPCYISCKLLKVNTSKINSSPLCFKARRTSCQTT